MTSTRASTPTRSGSSGRFKFSWRRLSRRPLGAHDRPVPVRHCCQAHYGETRYIADLRRERARCDLLQRRERQQARACLSSQPEDGRRRNGRPLRRRRQADLQQPTCSLIPPALKITALEIVKTIRQR